MKFILLSVTSIATIFNSAICFADQTGAATAPENNVMSQMIFFAVIFAAFYFFMFRPQNKRAKEHRDLISGVTSGDEVVTTGGIFGKISKVEDSFFMLAIADGVEIKVQKQAVTAALPKGTLKAK